MQFKFTLLFSILTLSTFAQEKIELTNTKKDSILQTIIIKKEEPILEKAKKWYETINLRGYVQIRYNRLLETNSELKCDQCDKSLGAKGAFFIRRARLIFSGNVHDRVYMYIQPDFASQPSSSTTLHFAQIRDAYFDLALDKKKEFRLRIGQSKVPYGFENMQSSQNRLSLDRNDALNSAVSNERDLGVFFYYAPQKVRTIFSDLISTGLKGSGDYGLFAFGTYNGQTANQVELNNNLHIVSRITYPFKLKNGQFLEAGIQAYTGETTIGSVTSGVKTNKEKLYKDERAAASLIIYPQPFGFQAEYNIGTGPQYDKNTNSIVQKELYGGYALINYQFKLKKQLLFPFVKYQTYDGGKKFELDARSYYVRDLELGLEWQPIKNFELVATYLISERRFEDAVKKNNHQKGNVLRLQAQFNF